MRLLELELRLRSIVASSERSLLYLCLLRVAVSLFSLTSFPVYEACNGFGIFVLVSLSPIAAVVLLDAMALLFGVLLDSLLLLPFLVPLLAY